MRLLAVTALAALALAVAQDGSAPPAEPPASEAGAEPTSAERRIITIDGSGGTQRGNLRSGPIIYEHPDEYGVTATVSTLTIRGSHAELSAPEGTSISNGGERTAAFEGGVLVERGRLTALGPALVYSEATGVGVLEGPAEVTVAAEEEGGEPVEISAELVEFDVDTDRSTSTGSVRLVNGNQQAFADQLIYEEERTLGVFTSEGEQARMTRLDEDGTEMVITADEIRVLTDEKLLYASGNVRVVDGSITSTGAAVFFDDEQGVAEIIGSADQPAHSVDEESGATLTTDRILHDVEFGFFEAIDASVPSEYDVVAFALSDEPER